MQLRLARLPDGGLLNRPSWSLRSTFAHCKVRGAPSECYVCFDSDANDLLTILVGHNQHMLKLHKPVPPKAASIFRGTRLLFWNSVHPEEA